MQAVGVCQTAKTGDPKCVVEHLQGLVVTDQNRNDSLFFYIRVVLLHR